MSSRSSRALERNPIVLTFLILAILAFLVAAKDVLQPLALSILVAFALAPLVHIIQKRGVPRMLSVILVISLTFALFGTGLYFVGRQAVSLVARIPTFENNIVEKLQWMKSNEPQTLTQATQSINRMSQSVLGTASSAEVIPVRIVPTGWLPESFDTTVSPLLDLLGHAAVVLVITLFLLADPTDLMDRVIRLVGLSRMSLTIQTMDELGRRISRYLVTFVTVNSLTGLAVGVGLWMAGIQYAALWGIISATFRFVPYLGPMLAFISPLIFTFASTEGWSPTLLAAGVIILIEIVDNIIIEPIVYGKSSGVTPLALLVAAAFWTTIWGPLGLLLSTALTVSLTVLGRYVPQLRFLDILMGEDTKLGQDVKLYQHLITNDEDVAWEILEAELEQHPYVEVCDTLILPTLARVKRDVAKGTLEASDEAFVYRVIRDFVVEIEDEQGFPGLAPTLKGIGIPSEGEGDVLGLRMLSALLRPLGIELSIEEVGATPLELTERVTAQSPELVVISRIVPGGAARSRYLVRKLRSHDSVMPILVCEWASTTTPSSPAPAQREAHPDGVVTTMAGALEWIQTRSIPAATAAQS